MSMKLSKTQIAGFIVVLAVIAIAVFLGYRYGPAGQVSPLARLPKQDATFGHVDVSSIRSAGLLGEDGSGSAYEPEYEAFIRKSGFNWEQDLDRLWWSFTPSGKFFVVEGRFNWKRLEEFVATEGGTCRDGYCTLRGSQPGREISFFPIDGHSMALAVSPDRYAADQLREKHQFAFAPPAAPLWMHLTKRALATSEPDSPGLRGFTRILQQTERATVALDAKDDAFELRLSAECSDAPTAEQMAADLNKLTGWLQQLLKIESAQPDETEMAAILSKGSFRAEGKQLMGEWPVSRTFLSSVLVEP